MALLYTIKQTEAMKTAIEQKAEIEKQLTSRGVSFDFVAISEGNGLSIYFNINGRKARFSGHSTTNKDRVVDEMHFDLPFAKTLGLGGVIKEKYNDNARNFNNYFI